MKSVLVFGDSITWGAIDLEKGGWVERLKISLMSKVDVFNLGIPGDTSQDIVDRLEGELKARFYDENIIVFAIGINDSLYPENIGYFEDNLKEMCRIVKKYSKRIFFVGLTKVDESLTIPDGLEDAVYKNKDIENFDKIIRKISEQEKAKYIELPEVELADGLHPSSSGHEKIFKEVRSHLFI